MTRFVKAHAYGNDFLYVRRREIDGAALDALAREMCDRHHGIGADGLVVYDEGAGLATMQLFNADGGRAEVSGNGLRALAALLLEENSQPAAEITIRTDAGLKHLTRVGREGTRQTFRAAMGLPVDIHKILPLEVCGETIQPITLAMGNPHCVILGPLPDNNRFRRLGAALERHDLFPDGTNVEFADVEAPDRVRILIWERGVGPTQSSGTGSCAALVASASFGGAAHRADVIAPGGSQRVEWTAAGVYLTGWAEIVCEGVWRRQIPRTV
jgi:diaminopimelate epimerase